MKHWFKIWFLLATGLLAACGADIDNSEPPAELTIIEDQMKLVLLWRVDTLASSNSASYRLRPLIIDDLVYEYISK